MGSQVFPLVGHERPNDFSYLRTAHLARILPTATENVMFHSYESSDVHARMPEKWVFDSLDHRCVGDGDDGWVVSVVGVHIQGDAIWVQLVRDDCDDDTIIVQMERDTKPADVLASLRNAVARSRLIVVPASGSKH